MTQMQNTEQAETYIPFVRKIACRMARRLPQTVELDDLVSAGTVGLMEALGRYDPAGGRSFETYAEFRVKGAILDELRRNDPLSRSIRTRQNRIAGAVARLTAEYGRPPDVEEIAAALDTSVDVYVDKMSPVETVQIISFESEAAQVDNDSPSQEELLGHKQTVALVRRAIEALPYRQQLVLNLYYVERLNQAQVGQLLNVSESRICQILSETVQRIRKQVKHEVE